MRTSSTAASTIWWKGEVSTTSRRSDPSGIARAFRSIVFVNSATLVFEHPRSLIYVEGYVLPLKTIALPIHHAWCVHVRDLGKAIDVTLDGAAGYFGIPFETRYLAEQWSLEEGAEERVSASLIDNVEDGFPLLRMSAEELAAVVYKGKKI